MRDCELFTICFTCGHLPWTHRQCHFCVWLRFCSHPAPCRTFRGTVAGREVARPIYSLSALALGGPEPFLRLLLHNEGSSLVVYYYYCYY